MPHRVKEIRVDVISGKVIEKSVKSGLAKKVAQNWANKLNEKQELPPAHQAVNVETETPKFITSYVVEEV